MKGLAPFVLGGLAVVALLLAFAVGRYGTGLRGGLEPTGEGVDRGWRLELAYAPEPLALPGEERPTPAREVLPGVPETRRPAADPGVERSGRGTPEAPATATPGVRRSPAEVHAPFPIEENGPDLVGWYGSGRPSFRGTQMFDGEEWVREGEWRAWHENGAEHEIGAYRAGREQGPWQWFYDNGLPMAEGTFDEGRRVGHWRFWYENGSLQMEGDYVDGEGTGLWTHYHESGGKKAQGRFQRGKPNGLWTVWTPAGAIDRERTGEYIAGVRQD